MAQKTILQMVRNRLPFLATGTANDELINDFTQDVYYYLQPWTKYDDAVVELDETYRGSLRILVSEITAYNIIIRKILLNMGGAAGSGASAGKHIKKGKADVVEAEFEYAKAQDGNELLLECEKLLPQIKTSMCNYALSIGYYLPDCNRMPPVNIPTFQVFVPGE